MITEIIWRPIRITDEIKGIEVKEIDLAYFKDPATGDLCWASMCADGTPYVFWCDDIRMHIVDEDNWDNLKAEGFDLERAVTRAMDEMAKSSTGNWTE